MKADGRSAPSGTLPHSDFRAWLPWALLIAALCMLFHPLLRGETLFWGLPTLQFYPWRDYAFEQVRAGHLPTWNPYLGAGAPLLANHQTALFYPPNWLWLLLPGPAAMSAVALGHVLWSAAGMALFCQSLGCSRFGQGTALLAYALCGYLIARLFSFPTANAAAWIPWLFWLADRTLKRRRLADVGWLGLAFAAQVLSGHAQTTWYGLVALGVYAVWSALWGQRDDSLRARALGLIGCSAGIALGALIAAVQILPTAEYLAQSQRSGGLDYATLTNLSYHPLRLLTLLSPQLLGTPADGSTLGEGIYFENAAYIGLIPLLAAIAAIWARVRLRAALDQHPALRMVPVWTALALGGLLLAAGHYAPYYRLLFAHVPTFDAFREPVRWLILTEFGLAVLAGIGVDHWGRGPRIVFWSRLAAAGGGGMALLALLGLLLGDFTPTLEVLAWGLVALGSGMAIAALLTLMQPVPPLHGSPGLWRALVLIAITLDLAWMASGLNPTVPEAFFARREMAPQVERHYWFADYRQAVTFGSEALDDSAAIEGYFDVSDYRIAVRRQEDLRASRLPNLALIDRLPALNNNDPLLPAVHSAYLDQIEALGTAAGPLLQAAGVGEVFGLVPQGWTASENGPARAPYEPQIAWLVSGARWFADDEALSTALRDPAWDPTATVLLSGTPPASAPVTVPAAGSPGSVTLLRDDPAARAYGVRAEGPAWLVIAETWYPGWSARVNGAAVPLQRANLSFMAVAVPPGASTVTLRYRLSHWATGVALTLGGLGLASVAVAGAPLARAIQRRRRPRQ